MNPNAAVEFKNRSCSPGRFWVTGIFCFLTVIAALGYWITGALASWGGPEDDIAVVYLLAPFVLLHAFLISRCGLLLHSLSTLVYASVVAALLVARHIEMSGRAGYNHWLANRSLESLGWTLGWFAFGLAFTLVRWYAAPESELDEP